MKTYPQKIEDTRQGSLEKLLVIETLKDGVVRLFLRSDPADHDGESAVEEDSPPALILQIACKHTFAVSSAASVGIPVVICRGGTTFEYPDICLISSSNTSSRQPLVQSTFDLFYRLGCL